MIDRLTALIVDESKWLTMSLSLALVVVAVLLYRYRGLDTRSRVTAAMNMFLGITIGTMSFGHILAVTTKLLLGTLEGPVPLFYVIGIALAIPSWWLIFHTRNVLTREEKHRRLTLALNAWLAITLVAMGVNNLPLATPAVLNIGYVMHSHKAMGWTIVGIAVAVHVGLFIGSLIFLASGQTFEQFGGME